MTSERPPAIETLRLELLVLLPRELRALIAGDTAQASKQASVTFLPGWPESADARTGLTRHLTFLESDERQRAWRTRAIVERATGIVVGAVNLQGPPDENGDVEIGWGVIETRRRRGYAVEAASALIDWVMRQPGTHSMSATIAEDNIASQHVAARLGFVRTTGLRRDLPVWCRRVAEVTVRPAVAVRDCRPEDEQDVEEVDRLATEGLRRVYVPTELARQRRAAIVPELRRLAAETEGRVVGVVQYHVSEHQLSFLGLGVHPQFQRCGVARGLIGRLESIARSHGCSAMTLHTVRETGNVAIFQRLGFLVASEAPTDLFQSEAFSVLHEVVMRKDLI